MPLTRSQRHLLVVCLVLAGVLFRGLIPAGFMPATGEAARRGELVMLCPHGTMDMGGHGGKHGDGPALEQCPFGAAAAPSLPGGALALHLPPAPAHVGPARDDTSRRIDSPRLLPPARAPPLVS